MISNTQFRQCIIQPVLSDLSAYGIGAARNAEEILVATMAHETLGCKYIIQQGNSGIFWKGGLGPFQMEAATHDNVVSRYFPEDNVDGKVGNTPIVKGHLPIKKSKVTSIFNFNNYPEGIEMVYNFRYATLMARLNYWLKPGSLPQYDDINGIWSYYKSFWNTEKGSATKDDFLKNYYEFIGKRS